MCIVYSCVYLCVMCVYLRIRRHMKAEGLWKMMQDELLPRYMWPEPVTDNILNVESAVSSPRAAHNRQKPGHMKGRAHGG